LRRSYECASTTAGTGKKNASPYLVSGDSLRECFLENLEIQYFIAELIVDKAMEMRYVGGVYSGNIKPTPFLCLTLKILQIQPEKDIIIEFVRQEESKLLLRF